MPGRCGIDSFHFNPPTPCGVGRGSQPYWILFSAFQSTHPVWGGTNRDYPLTDRTRFQSTHPVWGGTHPNTTYEESRKISIHPPRVGWDWMQVHYRLQFDQFQSTHPVWGGTGSATTHGFEKTISIHPPRVGWDQSNDRTTVTLGISIHPPRVGWDARVKIHKILIRDFNPPTPCGVGPELLKLIDAMNEISIHPPRVGWDGLRQSNNTGNRHFNPPTPCGVGLVRQGVGTELILFQSTHPVWGGTGVGRWSLIAKDISIHPPRVGWDGKSS